MSVKVRELPAGQLTDVRVSINSHIVPFHPSMRHDVGVSPALVESPCIVYDFRETKNGAANRRAGGSNHVSEADCDSVNDGTV